MIRIPTPVRCATLFLTSLLAVPASAAAQKSPDATFEAHGGVGFPTRDLADLFDLGPEAGAGLSFWLGPRVAIRLGGDLEFLRGAGSVLAGASGPDGRLYSYTGGLAFELADPKTPGWDVLLNVGGGGSTLDTDPFPDPAAPGSTRDFTKTYPTANLGLTIGYDVSPSVNLFVESQAYLTFFKKADTRVFRDASAGRVQAFGSQLSVPVAVGFKLKFGGPSDADGDGVEDALDQCPGTPDGVVVDTAGCPRDADRDGVPDYADQCSGTPMGAQVDTKGCAHDSDIDGVADGIDKCPNTPEGAHVDATGCPTDADADGVADGIDQCPSTPEGVRVDKTGCALDGDGDGVPDGIDKCPNTAPNTEVDETGCPRSKVQEQLEEKGRVVLHNVYFDFDRATIRPESRPALDEVGNALVKNRQLRVEIQGHTDAVGPAAYNLELSQRRARAVLEYLLANFPSLDRGEFVVRGYGETQPIASNATAEGRQENRRVEFVVLEGSGNVSGQRQVGGS
ncbi:MAG TPA: OmpA family protein [Gemmatimonadota bacterium]|nr:OmpA family protein [Gemmatimonadota bacterium]